LALFLAALQSGRAICRNLLKRPRSRLSPLPGPHDQQRNPTDERQPSKNGRKGNSLSGSRGDMKRPDINDLFMTGVGDTLIGEGQPTQYDQQNSSQNYRFHIFRCLFAVIMMLLRPDLAGRLATIFNSMSGQSSALNEPDHHGNDRQDQQNVDKSTHSVGGDQA